jgi:hypothetical protein
VAAVGCGCLGAVPPSTSDNHTSSSGRVADSQDEEEQEESDDEAESMWESYPQEIDCANVQILDKISGKVFRSSIKLNRLVAFGSIILRLRRCFKNSPEDNPEVYAYMEIFEQKRKIFSNWKFASYPSINVLEHPVYDVRIEL